MPPPAKLPDRPTDGLVRAVCSGLFFIGFGFVNHRDGFWAAAGRLAVGGPSGAGLADVMPAVLAFGCLAWMLGATVETVLVSVGVRLTYPPDQQADYDDRPDDPV